MTDPIFEITKAAAFDAAHYIEQGPADHRYRRLHGHSFRVEATVRGPAALAIVAVALSVAVAGLALAALCRNPRPYELAMVFLAYIAVQDDATLNALADPGLSLARHSWLLPAFVAVLAIAWPWMHRRR